MSSAVSKEELQQLLDKCLKKVAGKRENDVCRYLPVEGGGYMHHFTLRKMKNEQPAELATMLKTFILDSDAPITVPPKPRAPRGTRKRREQFAFSKSDWERMLNLARLANDKEMIRKLTPKKDLRTIKRELIASIRHNTVDQELWASYVEALSAGGATTTTQNAAELLSSLSSNLNASQAALASGTTGKM
jgi:hypothetical protein